jgi:hypothetical protein
MTKCDKIVMNQNRLTRTDLPHYYRHRGFFFSVTSNAVFMFLGTATSFEFDLE